MIEAEGVARSYARGAFAGLRGVTFRVNKGEVLGVLGGDRSGKTTLVRIIAALLRPSAGRASVGGFDVASNAGRIRSNVGYLPQISPSFGNLTTAQYLDFWGQIDGLRRAERKARISDLLSFFDLTGRDLERVVDATLATQRRLYLAVTLLSDPSVLVLDEPLAGLEPAERDALAQKLKALQGQGKTILLTATRLSDLSPVCSHLVTLYEGRSTRSYVTSVLLKKVGEARHARVFIETAAPASDVRTAIHGLRGVVDVKEGTDALVLFVEPGAFRMDDLRNTLESAGVKVKSIREAALTIGDIFRTLSWVEGA